MEKWNFAFQNKHTVQINCLDTRVRLSGNTLRSGELLVSVPLFVYPTPFDFFTPISIVLHGPGDKPVRGSVAIVETLASSRPRLRSRFAISIELARLRLRRVFFLLSHFSRSLDRVPLSRHGRRRRRRLIHRLVELAPGLRGLPMVQKNEVGGNKKRRALCSAPISTSFPPSLFMIVSTCSGLPVSLAV